MANAVSEDLALDLLQVWQQHTNSEFVLRDADASLTTMSGNPHVVMVPLTTGGRGRQGVYNYFHDYFLGQMPGDIVSIPISRVVGKNSGRSGQLSVHARAYVDYPGRVTSSRR